MNSNKPQLTPEQVAAVQKAITDVTERLGDIDFSALADTLVQCAFEIRSALKKTLKEWRLEAGMTQKEAAAALEVSHDTIKRWEAGETFPNAQHLLLIATTYGVHFDKIDFEKPKKG